MPVAELETIYRSYLACCNERKFTDLGDFVHNALQHNGATISLDHFTGRLRSVIEAVPDFRWELQDLVVDDRKVAVRIMSSGTPRAEWMGMAPNGKSVKAAEYAFYHFREGKIAKIWFLFDILSIRSQLS